MLVYVQFEFDMNVIEHQGYKFTSNFINWIYKSNSCTKQLYSL